MVTLNSKKLDAYFKPVVYSVTSVDCGLFVISFGIFSWRRTHVFKVLYLQVCHWVVCNSPLAFDSCFIYFRHGLSNKRQPT